MNTFVEDTCPFIIIRSKRSIASGESWKYLRGKNGVHAFGYNSAESEPIIMKSGALWGCEHIVGSWPWQILSAIRAVATAWKAANILFFGQVNNARFHRFSVVQILQHLNTTSRSARRWKLSEQNFESFTVMGRFFPKTQKIPQNFHVLRLQAVISS